jgi:hypothetical protein
MSCGPKDAKFKVDSDETNHPLPEAKPDMALVYVLRTEQKKITAQLAVDGEWLGANKGKSYFVIFVAPGKRSLCSSSRGGKVEILAEFAPGKTYYLEQHLNLGGWFAAPIHEELLFLDEAKGKPLVNDSKLSVMSKKN